MQRRIKWSGIVCLMAGLLWVILWAGYMLTHGPSMFDQRGRFLNLTWYDISKFVVFALAGFGYGLIGLRKIQSVQSGRLGNIGYALSLIGLTVVGAGALGFWIVPWGSYAGSIRETILYQYSGIMMFLSPVILGLGMILFGYDLLRHKILSRGNWLPLLIGIAAFSPYLLWTNIGFIFGLLWGLLGFILITEDGVELMAT